MANNRRGGARKYDFANAGDVMAWCREFESRFPARWPAVAGGHQRTAMALNGHGASVMFAPRLEGDTEHMLPPGSSAPAYLVAEYEGCPTGWRKQDAFFVPVPLDEDGKGPGMWYDWTMNANNTHDVAIVPSTTGLNPITGQKADALRLERYVEKCPVHNVEFEGERFCKQCNDGNGLQWPPQNYVAGPNTLWWDGFRRPNGTVRQFWFSADALRDVGIAVLGKDRVPAFGFAFFLAVQPKPPPPMYARRSAGPIYHDHDSQGLAGGLLGSPGGGMKGANLPPSAGLAGEILSEEADICCFAGEELSEEVTAVHGDQDLCAGPSGGSSDTKGIAMGPAPMARGGGFASSLGSPSRGFSRRSVAAPMFRPAPPRAAAAGAVASVGATRRAAVERTVAVGAGSVIRQNLVVDPKSLTDWQPEPAAVITVYFVPEEVAMQILQGPKRDLVGAPEGFLAGTGVELGVG